MGILFNHRGHREHGGLLEAETKFLSCFPQIAICCKLLLYSVLSVSSVVFSLEARSA
jgi:hypothetical protein